MKKYIPTKMLSSKEIEKALDQQKSEIPNATT